MAEYNHHRISPGRYHLLGDCMGPTGQRHPCSQIRKTGTFLAVLDLLGWKWWCQRQMFPLWSGRTSKRGHRDCESDASFGKSLFSVFVRSLLIIPKLTGVQTGLMMSRTTMFVGWYELFMSKFGGKREFVSLDAKRYSQDARTFELVKAGGSPRAHPTPDIPDSPDLFKTGGESVHSIPPGYGPPGSAHSERAYRQHTLSFSGPRAPSSQGGGATDWQSAEEVFARGGLHSHPPQSPPPRGRSSFDPPSPPLPPPPPVPSSPPKRF
jgi:hypothetical protein